MCACKSLWQNYIPVKKIGLYLNFKAAVLLYETRVELSNSLSHSVKTNEKSKDGEWVSSVQEFNERIFLAMIIVIS